MEEVTGRFSKDQDSIKYNNFFCDSYCIYSSKLISVGI